jgi:hypothetical protein
VSWSWTFEGGDPASSDAEDAGSVTYNTAGTYTTTFSATDDDGDACNPEIRTVTVTDPGGGEPPGFPAQTDYKIMMNYELGMHCTGFEFAYCCVLPVYNSILAQIVKPQGTGSNSQAPVLLEADHNIGLDALSRPTVVRDKELDANGNFKKYVVRYWHDAQDRSGDTNGKAQTSTLISAVEGNSLFAWNTTFDSAEVLADGSLNTAGSYNGADAGTVIRGNGILNEDADNYQNAVWNHLYIYSGLEGATSGFCSEPSANVDNKCVIDQNCNTAGTCEMSTDPEGNPLSCTGDNDCGLNDQCLDFVEDGVCDTSVASTREKDKVRLGVNGHIVYPKDCGAALHPMGPDTSNGQPIGADREAPDNPLVANDCGGFSNGNVLTFSGHTGTVVYTQMKVLENLPVMLTSPDIWEALGLPLTPFEDTIDFFGDPGLVDEDSIRPYVPMKAQLYNHADGSAVLDGSGNPVIGFGTAPIDIPNCERCHSNPPDDELLTIYGPEADPTQDVDGNTDGVQLLVVNSPNGKHPGQWAMVQAEYSFWNAYYGIDRNLDPVTGEPIDSDWYSRLKSAAISMLYGHDQEHGTFFTSGGDGVGGANPDYPVCGGGLDVDGNFDPDTIDSADCGATPQNTRLGHEAVICQRCHADNVIAVVKSATHSGGELIMPITEAVHNNHALNDFADGEGRDGSCQGCHPAHRSDGTMAGYPITLAGANLYGPSGGNLGGDNRDANGGCFVGRDVHSNPGKDDDGAETPEHLNAVGQWLSTAVFSDQGANGDKGIWCTNCHSQLGQEMWKAENVYDLVKGLGVCVDGNGTVGDPAQTCKIDDDCSGGDTCALNNIRNASLEDIANAVADGDIDKLKSWADPKIAAVSYDGVDRTNEIWAPLPEPALCAFLVGPGNPANDGNVATIEVAIPASGHECSTPDQLGPINCSDVGGPIYNICGEFDKPDGDFSVNILDFCTTDDCVKAAQFKLGEGSAAVPVPMSAATDGRDHWLSPGEPHCADCHAAPYVEQSGNINAFPPFNYPRKASLMRYSRGHQDITCQGCHESIHGLYPVTPSIDTTSYAQAAALNHDGSHGPLKCGTCHTVGADGIPSWVKNGLEYTDPVTGQVTQVAGNFDAAVGWMHTYTDETSPLDSMCLNCHGVKGNDWDVIGSTNKKWIQHTYRGRVSREAMDKTELAAQGFVSGDPDADGNGITLWDPDADPYDPENNPTGVDTGEDPLTTVCVQCHQDRTSKLDCSSTKWKDHLITGRVAEKVWEFVTEAVTGTPGETCGW